MVEFEETEAVLIGVLARYHNQFSSLNARSARLDDHRPPCTFGQLQRIVFDDLHICQTNHKITEGGYGPEKFLSIEPKPLLDDAANHITLTKPVNEVFQLGQYSLLGVVPEHLHRLDKVFLVLGVNSVHIGGEYRSLEDAFDLFVSGSSSTVAEQPNIFPYSCLLSCRKF